MARSCPSPVWDHWREGAATKETHAACTANLTAVSRPHYSSARPAMFWPTTAAAPSRSCGTDHHNQLLNRVARSNVAGSKAERPGSRITRCPDDFKENPMTAAGNMTPTGATCMGEHEMSVAQS